MERFSLVEKVNSYQTKPDPTSAPENVLVSGSQNILINERGKISTRLGYSLLGAANAAFTPVKSSFTWQTSSGTEIVLRGYDDELEIYTSTLAAWTRLKDGLSSVTFQFTTWWSTTEGIDLLVFVDGTDDLYEWSGGIAVLASATVNTITKTGTGSWAASRFLTAGTRKAVINGTEYTYTGGETTTTLTGVTPDPSAEAVSSNVFQAIRTNTNTPAADFLSSSVRVLNNQLWVFSNTSRLVYVSKDTDHTSYAFSSPRIPGEGALLKLDNVPKALAIQNKDMYISAGRDDWYKSEYEQLNVNNILTETLKAEKLKTTTGMAAQSQDLTLEAGDFIAFIDHNNVLRLLGKIENVEESAIRAFSNPIKPDFEAASFANGHLIWDKNRIYISDPANDKIYILEMREDADGTIRRFWQPPQILPMRRLGIIGGNLHGYSNASPETYKLFDGLNDNGNQFKAVAKFAYRSYGRRDLLKELDEWLTEGYVSANAEITLRLDYDFEGSTQSLEIIIKGSSENILFQPAIGGALGTEPIGTGRIGAPSENIASQNPKFRSINEFPAQDFFEIQPTYESDIIDAVWEILASGGNVKLSENIPASLKS